MYIRDNTDGLSSISIERERERERDLVKEISGSKYLNGIAKKSHWDLLQWLESMWRERESWNKK